MPKPYPRDFHDDAVAVAVARKRKAPLKQVAKDFGVSESCLSNWLRRADVEAGDRPGLSDRRATELRELRKHSHLLDQENEVLRRAAAYLSHANSPGDSLSRSPVGWPRTEPGMLPVSRRACLARLFVTTCWPA